MIVFFNASTNWVCWNLLIPLSRSQLKGLVCLTVTLVTMGFRVTVGLESSTLLKGSVSTCTESEAVGCLEDVLTERAAPRDLAVGIV